MKFCIAAHIFETSATDLPHPSTTSKLSASSHMNTNIRQVSQLTNTYFVLI